MRTWCTSVALWATLLAVIATAQETVLPKGEGEGNEDFVLVTVATERTPGFLRFIRSADVYGHSNVQECRVLLCLADDVINYDGSVVVA
ncbi:unnamed protein product, partial [Darwinula stevensoni]